MTISSIFKNMNINSIRIVVSWIKPTDAPSQLHNSGHYTVIFIKHAWIEYSIVLLIYENTLYIGRYDDRGSEDKVVWA